MFPSSKLLTLVSAIAIVLVLPSSLRAQVIQLPSVQQFSYSGGAIVPDSGTGYLGGVNRSSTGSVSTGSPWNQNRAIGGSSGASHVTASVQVIDLAALDQAILNANVSANTISQANNRVLPVSEQAAADQARKFLTNYPKLDSAKLGGPSYRDIHTAGDRPREAIDPGLAESNVRHFLKLGQQAEAENRIQSARVYYKLAIESMTPELIDRYNRVLEDRKKAELEKEKAKKAGRRQF